MSKGLRFAAAAVVLASLMACSASPGPTSPFPTWPVEPELLAIVPAGSGAATATCGGRTFPVSGFEAPTGAEKEVGPEFDALRESIDLFGPEFRGSDAWTWRLAGSDDHGAIFLARTDDLGPPGWISVEVTATDGAWMPLNWGQCEPHAVLSDEYGSATWALDPSVAPPDESTTELHILVWERTCSHGSPATGRMSAPVVIDAPTTVTITIGVRPIEGPPGFALSCPLPPGTPAILRLPEPLGERTLLDGGYVPPAPPRSP